MLELDDDKNNNNIGPKTQSNNSSYHYYCTAKLRSFIECVTTSNSDSDNIEGVKWASNTGKENYSRKCKSLCW